MCVYIKLSVDCRHTVVQYGVWGFAENMSSESKKLSHGEAMSNIGSKVRASFGLTFGFIFVSYTFFPFDLPPMPKIEDRLVFALECHALTMCIVIHLIQVLCFKFKKCACVFERQIPNF